MAETDAKTRVHNAIKDGVLKFVTDGKKELAELSQAMVKVDQAMKKGVDPDMLATYRRELGAKMRALGMVASGIASGLITLKKIAEDESDFEADSDEIEAVQDRLTKSKNALTDWIVKAKKLDDRAKESVQTGEKSEKVAHREWDLMIDGFSQATVAQLANAKGSREALQKANDAVKARDADALSEQLVIATLLMEWPEAAQGQAFTAEVKAYCAKYDITTFSKEFNDEIAKDRATVADYNKRLQAAFQADKQTKAEAAKLKIAPPDYVKVTAKLGFKANLNARVEKALKLDEARLAKELEAIAKDAGVKGTGKEFIARLRKEKLYP